MIGFLGSIVMVGFSIFELVFRIRAIFWWDSATYISGEYLLVSAIIGLVAGMFGLCGASVGQRLGGIAMIVAGAVIAVATSITGTLFGSLLVVGGIIALSKK